MRISISTISNAALFVGATATACSHPSSATPSLPTTIGAHEIGRPDCEGPLAAEDGALWGAHESLPLGTSVRVTNRRTSQSVVVPIKYGTRFLAITDEKPRRVIGLSHQASVELGLVKCGRSRQHHMGAERESVAVTVLELPPR